MTHPGCSPARLHELLGRFGLLDRGRAFPSGRSAARGESLGSALDLAASHCRRTSAHLGELYVACFPRLNEEALLGLGRGSTPTLRPVQ